MKENKNRAAAPESEPYMNNSLSKQHNASSLIKFAFPTIVMMLFMALYTMIAGFFVANFISADALAALNIVIPASGILTSLAVWLGAGGSVVISRKLGEGRDSEARSDNTMLILLVIAIGLVIMVLTQVFARPILTLLGATEELYPLSLQYYRTTFYFSVPLLLQVLFQYLFVTSGNPRLGLICVVVGGVTDMILEYVFIVLLDLGLTGAALATGIGYTIPAVTGLVWFACCKSNPLRFYKPKFRKTMFRDSLVNGAANMIMNLSGSVVTLLFNRTIVVYLGETGIAAATIVLYARFLFNSVLSGYSSGVAPVISFNYGRRDFGQVKSLFRISIKAIAVQSVGLLAACALLRNVIAGLFAGGDGSLAAIAATGILIFSLTYLFNGVNTFTNTLFSALGNGKISALMAFLYTFVFLVGAMAILPGLGLGVSGVWLAAPVAELCSVIVSVALLKKYQNVYGY